MRRIRIVGLCSLAVAASGAIAAEGASAALPELGRCVPVASVGAYGGAACVRKAPAHNGNYEWEPGPGTKPGFQAVLIGEVLLETVSGEKIVCGPSEIKGQWTGAKSASLNLEFHGCQDQ